MKNNIQTIDSLSHGLASFRIRSLDSFTYPSAVSELPEPPHQHNFQELIWIKSGVGKYIIDDQVLQIYPETFYLIAKGQIYQFFECTNTNGYVVGFADDFLSEPYSTEDQSSQLTIFNNINTIHIL